MKALLRMKHWQIFLLMFIGPMMIFFGSFIAVLTGVGMEWGIIFAILISLVLTCFWLVYQYSLVHQLSRLLPEGESINLSLFRICLVVPIGTITLMSVFMVRMFSQLYSMEADSIDPSDMRWVFGLFPVIIISTAASIYVLLMMAKSLVAVEKQRPVTFNDYVVEFILFWFSFIGIWILQPRINAIFDDNHRPIPPVPPSIPPIPRVPPVRSVPPPIVSG